MKYDLRRIQYCSNSIANLVQHNTCFHLVVAMLNNNLTAYIAVDPYGEQAALASAGISAAPSSKIQMRPGVCIERVKERKPRVCRPQPWGTNLSFPTPSEGANYLKPLCSAFTFDRAVRSMKNNDYIQVVLRPAGAVTSSGAFDSSTNQRFTSSQCFRYMIAGSSPAIAEALIDDIAYSQAVFGPVNTDHYESRRVNSSLMTRDEAILLASALDHTLGYAYKPDITSFMTPGTTQQYDQPMIVVGYNNGLPVGFEYAHFLKNISILGETGSGKSELLISIARQLSEAGVSCLFVAPIKQDFSAAFPEADIYRCGDDIHPLRYNLLQLPKSQKSVRLAASALGNMVSMGGDESALPMLYENSLRSLYASDNREPTLSALAESVKRELKNSGYKRESSDQLAQAAINRLLTLNSTPEFNASVSNIDMQRIFQPGRITILELNDLESEFRRAFTALFLERLRYYCLALPDIGRKNPRAVLLLDEVHELIREHGAPNDRVRDVLNSFLNVSGGKAVGTVLADQRLDLMSELAENGSCSHILMKGYPTEQAASVLRLPADSPMLAHSSHFQPGECLLHVTGKDTIAVSAAPLTERTAARFSSSPPAQAYCPYPEACRKSCTACNGQLHAIASDAVINVLASSAYDAYLRTVKMYAQKLAAYKAACAAHQHNPEAVPEPQKLPSKPEYIAAAQAELIKECVRVACNKARASNLDPSGFSAILYNCTKQELIRQMAFRLDN